MDDGLGGSIHLNHVAHTSQVPRTSRAYIRGSVVVGFRRLYLGKVSTITGLELDYEPAGSGRVDQIGIPPQVPPTPHRFPNSRCVCRKEQ